ncbi:putative peptidoglycan-binding domain-containing protein [Sphingomonas sp. MMS24-JH45]
MDTGVNMGRLFSIPVPTTGAEPVDRRRTGDGRDRRASIHRALEAFLKRRGAEGERRLLALLNAFQGARYADLAEGRSANRAFIYGWLGRITGEAA